MFGLSKANESSDFVFDLERELKDRQKERELKELLNSRIQSIKTAMRGGEDKEEYDKLGALLYGYSAMQKVFARVTRKK